MRKKFDRGPILNSEEEKYDTESLNLQIYGACHYRHARWLMSHGAGNARNRPAEMASFCFSDVFNNLSGPIVAGLEKEYAASYGRIPNRNRLRELSAQLGISQSRIRKWFIEKSEERPGIRHDKCDVSLMDQIEGMLDETDKILDSAKSTYCDDKN
jgi:hypothetical protein